MRYGRPMEKKSFLLTICHTVTHNQIYCVTICHAHNCKKLARDIFTMELNSWNSQKFSSANVSRYMVDNGYFNLLRIDFVKEWKQIINLCSLCGRRLQHLFCVSVCLILILKQCTLNCSNLYMTMSKATNLHRKTTKVHYYKVIVNSTFVNGRQSIKSQKDFSKKQTMQNRCLL